MSYPSQEGKNIWFTNNLTRLIIKIFSPPTRPPENSNIAIQKLLEEVNKQESITITHKSSKQLSMIQISLLQNLLKNFVSGTPDVQGAALVSPDGLPLTSILSPDMDEERTAAMSAAMLSLGERIGQELSRGAIERIFVEGEKGYSILVACGEEAVLLVLASKAAKKGLVFLEIKRLVGEIKPLLT